MTEFEREIEEIPGALRRLCDWYGKEGREGLDTFAAMARKAGELTFSGMGSSLFAPEIAFPRFARAGLSARSVDTGEWLHHGTIQGQPRGIVVLTSQSGESVELKRLLARGTGAPGSYVAVTNDESSTLARSASLTLPMHAGAESAISTKTWTNSIALYLLLAASLEGKAVVDSALSSIAAVARLLEEPLPRGVAEAAMALAGATGVAMVGRGASLVAARQWALTYMEGARLIAAAYSGGSFNHGPFEASGEGFRLVVLDAGGASSALAEGLAARSQAAGSTVVLVTPKEGPSPRRLSRLIVKAPAGEFAEELFPIMISKVQNTVIKLVAEFRGHEAGIFRHGGKVTTNE